MEGSYSKCNVQNAPGENFQTEVVDGLDRFSEKNTKKYQLSLLKLDWQEQLQQAVFFVVFLCYFPRKECTCIVIGIWMESLPSLHSKM